MRRLLIIPIVHTSKDLGQLEHGLERLKRRTLSDNQLDAGRRLVELFWEELRNAIEIWNLDFRALNVYQDALPVMEGVSTSYIDKIVDDLAEAGSKNHQLLQWLRTRGAKLIGTESPHLLVQEYKLMRRSMEEETIDLFSDQDLANGGDATKPQSVLAEELNNLLVSRDQFIADRIHRTLKDSQVGLLFLGMLHDVYPVARRHHRM